ncbi:MAG: hypothetical protein K6A44_04185 [bacterium]|nr:hypothetical protein [bacterium]
MFKKFLVILFAAIFWGTTAINAAEPPVLDKPVANEKIEEVQVQVSKYKEVAPLNLVSTPAKYLNKDVKIKAKFDKFSTIGLDYPPIKRDAKTYISFLIKRENANYNIPLSELKLIIKRDYAEKEMVNVEQGDEIEIYGNVFSNALGDPWVSVDKITILTVHPDKEKKEADKK